jgi:hypothetical protein
VSNFGKPFVERVMPSRVELHAACSIHLSNGAKPVPLDFFCGVRRYVALAY